MIPISTIIKVVNPIDPQTDIISEAAKVIISGGLVVFPTETVYGLGADALNPTAVSQIFLAKNRPSNNPLIVHICDPAQLSILATEVSSLAKKLIKKFWPGPLTILFPKTSQVPDITTADSPYVAVRMPDHQVALDLIRLSKTPIAAPSANLSGKPSPTSAAHCINDLLGRVNYIIDSGETAVGLESTVISLFGPPAILRPGGITKEQLEETLGITFETRFKTTDTKDMSIKSPGTMHPHYKPNGKVVLINNFSNCSNHIDLLNIEINKSKLHGKTAVISANSFAGINPDIFFNIGDNPAAQARKIFQILRECDSKNITTIYIIALPEKGIGLATMDRIRRSAEETISFPAC